VGGSDLGGGRNNVGAPEGGGLGGRWEGDKERTSNIVKNNCNSIPDMNTKERGARVGRRERKLINHRSFVATLESERSVESASVRHGGIIKGGRWRGRGV
jgi:hypothetical protein